jgi:uncharacterized phage-like protein YoqJ
MIIAGTGHRPNKLGGYSEKVDSRLVDLAESAITRLFPNTKQIISGMALGWDLALAEAAINLEIPLIAAIPCPNQYKSWPQNSQDKYNRILNHTSKVEMISKVYSVKAMQKRNEWMVDNCDTLLALWNGSNGGTANCINYANSVGRIWINLWENWRKYSGFY